MRGRLVKPAFTVLLHLHPFCCMLQITTQTIYPSNLNLCGAAVYSQQLSSLGVQIKSYVVFEKMMVCHSYLSSSFKQSCQSISRYAVTADTGQRHSQKVLEVLIQMPRNKMCASHSVMDTKLVCWYSPVINTKAECQAEAKVLRVLTWGDLNAGEWEDTTVLDAPGHAH